MIIKRDGKAVPFDSRKIRNAIAKANSAVPPEARYTEGEIDQITEAVSEKALRINSDKRDVHVEEIQNFVEYAMMSHQPLRFDVVKAYMLYRKQHEAARNAVSTLVSCKDIVDKYVKVQDWRVKENSTVTYSVGGLILSNSGAITANYWLSEIYDEEIANAHRNCDMHLHDLSMLTGYCAGWSLRQLIEEGLGGVPGKITSSPAKHLPQLCNQMVNFLGIMQNEWAG